MKQRLTGLIPAAFTPLTADGGGINLDVIEKYARFLIEGGAGGVFICGSTGESVSLTVEERIKVADRWQSVAGENLPVIVHVGNPCLPDCKVLAAHAQKIGARAISAMGPNYFKPATVEDLALFCAEIAAAAPELPFYYYHIPSKTGVNFPMAEFLKIAAERIPNLAGIKFTSEDLMDLGQCLCFDGGRFDILFGRDEMLLSSLVLGIRGAIGTTFNIAAPLYRRIITTYENGDIAAAQAEQARSRDMIAVLFKFDVLPACKAIMKMIGVDCGPVRLPMRDLSPEQYDALHAELDRIDFFTFRQERK